MEIALAIILLLGIYVLYKLFIQGWLFKIALFFGGWFGIYMACRMYIDGAMKTAITVGTDNPVAFSYAAVIPSVICFLALLTTKVKDNE